MCEFLNDLWRNSCGLHSKRLGEDIGSYALYGESFVLKRKRTEWNPDFEAALLKEVKKQYLFNINMSFIAYMKNRLLIGSFRYGLMSEQNYGSFNLIKLIHDKNDLYYKNKDIEALVDGANLCLLAYIHAKRLQYRPYETAYPLLRSDIFQYAIVTFECTNNPWLMVLLASTFMIDFMYQIELGAEFTAQDDKNHAKETI